MSTPTENRRAYSVEEAANQYKVSRVTIYRELQTGRLKSIKIRNSRRITLEQLRAWERTLSGGAA